VETDQIPQSSGNVQKTTETSTKTEGKAKIKETHKKEMYKHKKSDTKKHEFVLLFI